MHILPEFVKQVLQQSATLTIGKDLLGVPGLKKVKITVKYVSTRVKNILVPAYLLIQINPVSFDTKKAEEVYEAIRDFLTNLHCLSGRKRTLKNSTTVKLSPGVGEDLPTVIYQIARELQDVTNLIASNNAGDKMEKKIDNDTAKCPQRENPKTKKKSPRSKRIKPRVTHTPSDGGLCTGFNIHHPPPGWSGAE